jgi:hypothetical protein
MQCPGYMVVYSNSFARQFNNKYLAANAIAKKHLSKTLINYK